jgi:chromosome segregation ATPase
MSHDGPQSTVSDAQQQLAEFSQTVFTDLQHDFHELNHEIPKDSPLEPFRHEYAKLFGILQKSMTNQARYIDKCRVLESEIVGNKAKVRTVSKLSEEDARSISNLNDERDKKQAILNDNQALLREVLEENATVSSEIIGYENELEKCVSEERRERNHLKELKTRRVELTKEHEDLTTRIPQLQESNRIATEKKEQKEKEIEASRSELSRIEEMLEAKSREGQAEQQRLFELERDREATRLRLRDAQQYLKDRLGEVAQHQDSVRQLEKRVREQKRRFDGVKQDKQEASERNLKFQKDLDNLNQGIVAIEEEIRTNNQRLTDKQNEVKQLQLQVQAREGEREKGRTRQQELQDTYEQLKKEADAVKNQLHGAAEEIERLRREGESIRKQCDSITRDENAKLKKKEGELQKQHAIQVLLSLYKNQAHNIECEISTIKSHLQETQKKIFSIENDRERYSEELSAATSQFLHAQDVLREIEAKVAQKNKEIADGDKKVHQQQALYEKTRSERENAAKKVKEVEAEIKSLEGMFARMKFAIEQHKEDIKRKDRERMTDRRALEDVNREDGRLREKLTEVQIDSDTAKRAITAHEGELKKAAMTLTNAETHLHSDEQKLAAVKKRRDQMSNLNVEREMEVKVMHEKLEVIRNQCRRGEIDYDHTEGEISRIRAQLQQDQKRLAKLSEIDGQLHKRREQIHNKQKELYQLQAERSAMEEELAIPINIHRWTLLESSDPLRFDQLKRYQELQADLVAKTKEVADLQELIKQKESHYMELSAQLRRKPGLEVDQRVNEYRAKCKSEKFSLDQITNSLEMYRDMVKEYRKELADVQSELINKRDKWIRQKKRDLKHRQTLAEQQHTLNELGLDIQL